MAAERLVSSINRKTNNFWLFLLLIAISMQINKIRQLGRYLASMRNALFPNSPSGQTLQITIFEHGNNLMYSLASKEVTKGAAFTINSVQVGPGVEQGGDHFGLGGLVAGGSVEAHKHYVKTTA